MHIIKEGRLVLSVMRKISRMVVWKMTEMCGSLFR